MPAWRAFRFIDRAIISVTEQNLQQPFELIIVDDGSDDSDRTWEKIKSWEKTVTKHKYLSIKSIQLPCNSGPGNARRIAIKKSNGKYVSYLDTDDEFYPSRLLGALRVFEQNPKIDVVISKYIIKEIDKEVIYDPVYIITRIHKLLQKQNISIPLGIMHTREIYDKTSGWPKYLVCSEDGVLWRYMSEAGAKFESCNFIAGIYHIRKNGQSRTQRRFDNGMSFAFDSKHPNGSHAQYLDGLSDKKLSQYFD